MKTLIKILTIIVPIFSFAKMPDKKLIIAVKKACEADRKKLCKNEMFPPDIFSCLLDNKDEIQSRDCKIKLEDLERQRP